MFLAEAKRHGALDVDVNGFVGLDNVDGFTCKRRA
jgi:hypothetical protein